MISRILLSQSLKRILKLVLLNNIMKAKGRGLLFVICKSFPGRDEGSVFLFFFLKGNTSATASPKQEDSLFSSVDIPQRTRTLATPPCKYPKTTQLMEKQRFTE